MKVGEPKKNCRLLKYECSYPPEAIIDLIRLQEFIAVKSPYAAVKYVVDILLSIIEKLRVFPEIGLTV